MTTHRWLRISKWLVSLVGLALLLLVAAWLTSNWNDAAPQPRPAALQLPAPALADDRNAYFVLAGLHAAADRDPSVAGQALWKLLLARATVPAIAPSGTASQENAGPPQVFLRPHGGPGRASPALGGSEYNDGAVEAAIGKTLPSLPGCNGAMADCVAQWIDGPDTLDTQRKEHALLGQRCERLLAGDFQFDEALAPMRSVEEPVAQHGTGALNCSRWFLSGATLAWVQQDRTRVMALLGKADRLSGALLRDSHSLIGQMIAIRSARYTLDAQAALAVRDPGMATALTPLLAPLPDQVTGIKRWMSVEAAFNRGVNAEISAACKGVSTPLRLFDNQPASQSVTPLGWLCRHRIGWHPERSAQAIDAGWLQSIRQLDAGLPAALQLRSSQAARGSQVSVLDALRWQNTLGNMVLLTGPPDYGHYLARHADLELHREATALALQSIAAGVAAADRRAWLAQQPLSATARDRISWSDDGLVLSARSWQESLGPGSYSAQRDAIRITWPSPR